MWKDALVPLLVSQFRGSIVQPHSAAEFNADVSQRFSGVMSRIGHNRELLSQAATVVESFEATTLGGSNEETAHLPQRGVRIGRPTHLRFKSHALESHSGHLAEKSLWMKRLRSATLRL
eukprot:GHVU01178699.1.p1 GENE.GHVU01178699.1~~GHVU01178699.1.p1  ORF type:complete len:119 (-),score=5.83 GHVU01178699.1:118-474(-)